MGGEVSFCCTSRDDPEYSGPILQRRPDFNYSSPEVEPDLLQDVGVLDRQTFPKRPLRRADRLPVDVLGPDSWWIHGIYEEQALKFGLRRLDNMWATDDIGIVLPYDGVSEIRSKSMLCDLISGHSTVLPECGRPSVAARPQGFVTFHSNPALLVCATTHMITTTHASCAPLFCSEKVSLGTALHAWFSVAVEDDKLAHV